MRIGQRFHRLRFFVTDAWDEWRHSPGVNLLAVGTLGAALFLAGLVMLLIGNIQANVEHLREDIRVDVYLDDDIPAATRQALRAELRALDGVSRVDYVDKQQAHERYRMWANEMADLIGELEDNPLPASLEVFLSPGTRAEEIGSEIVVGFAGRAGVEEVRFDRDWLRRLESLLGLARIGGAALAVVIFSAVVFVMSSVLRLAVLARRTEIEIMLLVGATPGFVRGPFLVAGLAQGLLSSAAALLLVDASRRAAMAYAGGGSLALLDLVAARPLPLGPSALLVVVGLVVSLAGSAFAVRQSLGASR